LLTCDFVRDDAPTLSDDDAPTSSGDDSRTSFGSAQTVTEGWGGYTLALRHGF